MTVSFERDFRPAIGSRAPRIRLFDGFDPVSIPEAGASGSGDGCSARPRFMRTPRVAGAPAVALVNQLALA
jgi:hypothetical protein